jgi:4-hydroxy-tetrahydrodipicolinate synthase
MSRMVQAFAEGRLDEASGLHSRFYPLFRALTLETNPIPIKTAVSLTDRIPGEFRLPLCEMAPANAAKLLATLRNLNLVK